MTASTPSTRPRPSEAGPMGAEVGNTHQYDPVNGVHPSTSVWVTSSPSGPLVVVPPAIGELQRQLNRVTVPNFPELPSGSTTSSGEIMTPAAPAEDQAPPSPGTASTTPMVAPHHPPATSPPNELNTRTAVALILVIFLSAVIALALVYLSFPDLEPDEVEHVKFPKDIEDAKRLGLVLSHYKDRYFFQVLGGVFVTYLFLQTFAIPGSIFLSIISGFLFPFPVALLLICFCSATGASFCYLLSYLVGRRLVKKYLPERSASWSDKVQQHRDNLLSYIIFLRITPFLPNWFINIVSPVIDVALIPFWVGTFVGVAPPSFVAIQAGTTLQQMTSTTEALTFQSVALLVVFAILSIVPVIFRDRTKIKSCLFAVHERCARWQMCPFSCCAQAAAAEPLPSLVVTIDSPTFSTPISSLSLTTHKSTCPERDDDSSTDVQVLHPLPSINIQYVQ